MPFLAIASLFLFAQTGWVKPYQAVDPPVDTDRYIHQLGDKSEAVFAESDLITFICRSSESEVALINGLETPMKRLPNSDVWIAQARMEGWDKAFFGYSFLPGGFKPGVRITLQHFFGPQAPEKPIRQSELKGTYTLHDIESEALGETRKIEVYLPPNAQPGIPVIYQADGQGTRAHAEILDALIAEGKCRPVALVGVHNGGYRGKPGEEYDSKLDMRASEYLKAADADRYGLHLKFVVDEVMPWVEDEFKVSGKRADRAVTGFSNGGAFAFTAAVDRPEAFGAAMPYSVAAFSREDMKKTAEKGGLPRFYFCAGTLEAFMRGTQSALEITQGAGATAELDAYVSGHDSIMWQIAFAKHIQAYFPPV